MSRRPLPPNYGGTEDEMSSQGEFLSEYRRKNNHIYQQILLLITFIFGALAGLSAITPLSSTREIQQGQRDLTCALMILAAAALVFTMTSDIDYPTPAFDTSSPTPSGDGDPSLTAPESLQIDGGPFYHAYTHYGAVPSEADAPEA